MFHALRVFQNVILGFATGLLLFVATVPPAPADEPAQKFTAEQQQQLDVATRLMSRANELSDNGKGQDAIVLAKQALAIRKQILGNDHVDTATALSAIGLLLWHQGDFAGARPYYEESLKIYRKVLGEEHPLTVWSLGNLGVTLSTLGDFPAARPYFEQSLKITTKLSGDGHIDTVPALSYLGMILTEQGEYAAARSLLEKALSIRQKVLGNDHVETAKSLVSLGNVQIYQGDYQAARRCYEESLRIYRKDLGEESRFTLGARHSLAILFMQQGDYAAARSQLEPTFKIIRKTQGNDHPNVATVTKSLGELHMALGDYAMARWYFDELLRITKKALGDEHPTTSAMLNNLGLLLWSQKDYVAARPYFEQTLKINKKSLGDEHPDTASALNNLGLLLRDQGNYAAARPYFDETLKIRQKTLGDKHRSTAGSLNNLGELLDLQGDYAAARPYYEQALKIRFEVLGGDHPDTAWSLNDLMTLEMATGRWDAAGKLAEQSRRGARRYIARVFPALSEKEQRYFLERIDEIGFHAALSQGLVNRQHPEIATLSAGWLLNGKGVGHAALAEQTLLTRDLKNSDKNPELAVLVQKMTDTRQELARLTMSEAKPGPEAAARLQKINTLSADQDQLARQLTEKTGRRSETDPWVDLPSIRKALPAEGVLIDIARFKVFNFQAKGIEEKFQPARYVAWIIPPPDKGDVQIVDLGPADVIEAAVETARETIQAATQENGLLKQQGEEAAEKLARQSLRTVADLVWKPLADKLGGAKQLILSPDGALWLVPWGALPSADDKLLLESHPLRLIVSGRDVVPSRLATPTPWAPIVFADPNFDLSPVERQQAIQAMFPDKKLDVRDPTRGVVSQNALPRVSRLPNTATEAQAIAPNIERFTKVKALAYTDRFALESVFKKVQHPSLLVLSTHGFFLADQEVKQDDSGLASTETRAALTTVNGQQIENPLLRCGLLLAGCNSQQSSAGDDGILTGMEIVGVDLRGTELVVLSACETGIGKIRNGEGVAGLRQAFQLAGAKSVVATLWQVPDRDSMLIINDFFQNVADGQTKTDALRNAQLKRIQARREKNGAAHPFFWAAWTLTGE